MKRSNQRAAGTAALVLAAGFILTTTEAWAAEEPKPLTAKIINTLAEPVPVAPQGTTQVAGTVTVANPTTTVEVTNGPAGPLAVRNANEPARQPARLKFFPLVGTNDNYRLETYTVPAGKSLVIEHASIKLYSKDARAEDDDVGIRFGVFVPPPPGGDPRDFLIDYAIELPLTPSGVRPNNNTVTYVGSQPVRAYFNAGETLGVILTRFEHGGTHSSYVTLIGHLVDTTP